MPPERKAAVVAKIEVRAPESPIWVAGERACCIPAKRPGTSGTDMLLDRLPSTLPYLRYKVVQLLLMHHSKKGIAIVLH
nr:hypothetical protein [Tanacetum cinerariifolium]